jgi:hypothetical protein
MSRTSSNLLNHCAPKQREVKDASKLNLWTTALNLKMFKEYQETMNRSTKDNK